MWVCQPNCRFAFFQIIPYVIACGKKRTMSCTAGLLCSCGGRSLSSPGTAEYAPAAVLLTHGEEEGSVRDGPRGFFDEFLKGCGWVHILIEIRIGCPGESQHSADLQIRCAEQFFRKQQYGKGKSYRYKNKKLPSAGTENRNDF